MSKRKIYKRKRFIVPFSILLLLVLVRLSLPFVVKNYVNSVLAAIPGYHGYVQDIDLSLLRGAYVIDSLTLKRLDATSEVPFLSIPKTDISIAWGTLFKGRIVSELFLTAPEFIYVFEDQESESADPDFDDWTKALTDIIPIDINKMVISDGKMAFVQLRANPNIDLHFNNVNLNATNLRNVIQKELQLPSAINATATSIGKGKVELNGKMNLIKKIPDMDISFSLEEASATALNDFTKHYAEVDFESGSFNLYSEVAVADGYLTGYVKPLLKDAKLIGKDDGFLGVLWEGFVGFFKFLLKNKGNNTLATNIPLEGNLNSVEGKVWPTIFNTIKNGWVKAFENQVDGNIEFEDAIDNSKEEN